MIAVPAISSPGVSPQTAFAADNNGANPGFTDLLTLLVGALQLQPAPGDGAASAGDVAAPLAPDRDQFSEDRDELVTDPSLIAAPATARFQPSDVVHDVTAPSKCSADLNAALTIITAQTLEAPPAAGLPAQVSGGEIDPIGEHVMIDGEKIVTSADAPPQDADEAAAHAFAVTVSDDANAATAAKLPINGTDVTIEGSDRKPIALAPMDTAKQKIPPNEGTEVHSDSTAIVKAPALATTTVGQTEAPHRNNAAVRQVPTSAASDREARTIDAPVVDARTEQSNVGSEAQFSFAKNDPESFGQQGKFKPSEALIELSDATNSRFAHVQPDAGITPSQHHEKITNENGTTPWRPVLDRVAQEIKTHIQFGKHEAVIQLDPPELGKIKIDLRLDGGQIHARIVAEEPGTQALIENHLAELRQALDIGQVDFVDVRVEQQAANGGGGQWAQAFNDAPPQGQERGAGANPDRSANDAVAAALGESEAVDQGRISMWV